MKKAGVGAIWRMGYNPLMNRSTRMLVLAFAMTSAIPAIGAEPGQIEIDYTHCGDQVGLLATDAMLSDVLRALAIELHFELHFRVEDDRPVTVTLREPAAELIKVLGRDDSIMISNEVDPGCNGPVDRITTVWFFGDGPDVVYSPSTAPTVHQLPETGETQAQQTTFDSDVAGNDVGKDQEMSAKRRRDMSPEERYYDRLQRQAKKGKE